MSEAGAISRSHVPTCAEGEGRPAPLPAFLAGGGGTGALIAARDWSGTGLGPVASWPGSLRTALALVLRSPVPMVLLWGEDGVMLYNDAYSGFAGGRHPELLGSKVREGWPEVADFNDNVMRVGLAGGTLAYKNQELTLHRHGRPEPVWMDLDYSPVPDESGHPAGVLAVVIETTERVRAERRLEETAERHRLAIKATNDAIWDWDLATNQVLWNEALHAAYGHALESVEPTGEWWIAHIHPDDRARVDHSIHAVIDGAGESWSAEYRFRRADGSYADVFDRGHVIRDADGRAVRMIGAMLDLTSRKRAEAALRASEEFNRRVLAASVDCIKVLDLQGRLEFMSEGGLGVMEADAFDAVQGACWPDFWPGEERGKALAAVATARRGDTGRFQGFATTLKGTPRWWDVIVTPINGADGRPERLLAVSRDVTAARQGEEALRASNARFRAAIDAIQGVLWTNDAAGRMVGEQPGWAALTGQSHEDYQGYGWGAAVHPDDVAPTIDAWNEAVAEGRPFLFEHRVRRHDGEWRVFSIRAVPVRDAEGAVAEWVGVHTDVTDARRAEAALREREERLRLVVEGAKDHAILTTDAGGTITTWSAGAQAVFGWTPEEVVGQPASMLFTPEDRASGEDRHELDMAAREGRAPDERWHLRKDGSRVFISGSTYALHDEGGRARGFLKVGRDETARRTLHQAATRLATIVATSPDAIISFAPEDGRITSWNRGAEQLFGYAEAEAVGAPVSLLLPPPEHLTPGENETGVFRRAMQEGAVQVESVRRRKDGTLVDVSVSAARMNGSDGRVLGVSGIFHDVGDRRRSELLRREAERRQVFLLSLSDRLRALGGAREIMAATAEMLGRELGVRRVGYGEVSEAGDTITGERDWTDGTVPGVTGRFPLDSFGPALVAEARDGRTVRVGDVAADRRVGAAIGAYEAIGVRAFLAVPLVREGRLRAVLSLHHDGPRAWSDAEVTLAEEVAGRTWAAVEQARAEAALHQLNETLERQVAERTADRDRMWRLSTDLMLVARFDGTITATNPAWEAVLGWREAELRGTSFLDLVHPEDLASTAAEAGRLGQGLTTLRFENRYRAKDGTYRWLSWTAVPDEQLIHAVARDVEAEKRAQAELEAAQDALRQAQKMEAVGQLTGGIAHDFNNLLTGVIGSLDMMQRRIAKGETDRIERYATAAMTSANRAAALTHRLLAFSRRQPLDPKPVNANRLVTGMEELLRRTIGEAIRLEIVTAGGLWQTLCDPHQLESAVLNLAINARDAMPGGGKLTIETCNAHLDTAYAAKSREVRPGQYICICVTDTGTGMTPDVIAKAFDPFFTTKPIGQGTGLGLSMIYGFARQSEGYAKIYSEVGQGTTVKLYLPRYYGEAEDAEEAAGRLTEDHRAEAGETVLVVEDESAVRQLVVDVLEELGYRAVEAADGPSGLRLVQSDVRIDLLVTDVGLPGLNGRQLADAARQARPDLRVLFMTGYAENAAIANGFLEPGMEMITKPFAVEALAARIRDMIEGRHRDHATR